MTTYQRESHFRSLLKGLSWRVVATIDTIFIVLLFTCLNGRCSIENAIEIGLIEFMFKFFAYYGHERFWQYLLKQGAHKRETLFKTISWRVIATIMTFIISGTVLNAFDQIALYIALTELFTKFVLYYLHERMWLKFPLGKMRSMFL